MHGYVFTMQYPCGWVSPFGHCRIKACCQLPDTFRRLPRPSSPLTAKASTVCAYSLDHITPSRLGPICRTRMVTTYHFNKAASLQLALASRHVMDIRLKTLATSRLSKNTRPASAPGAFQIFVCAYVIQSWWVWEDSNHRPHPYQGCALTT